MRLISKKSSDLSVPLISRVGHNEWYDLYCRRWKDDDHSEEYTDEGDGDVRNEEYI